MENSKALPIIAGVEITKDDKGRFNLNALHRASGFSANKAPNQWLRTKQVKALVCELDKQTANMQPSVNVTDGGASPGTFAHELLAIEYAGWISPAFRLKVNQTFLDYKTGRLKPAQEVTNIDLAKMIIESEQERLALVNELEKAKPKLDALKRLSECRNSLCLRDAAKALEMKPSKLNQWLCDNKWTYKNSNVWMAYQAKIDNRLMEQKVTVLKTPFCEKIITQALITPKGLIKLAETFGLEYTKTNNVIPLQQQPLNTNAPGPIL